MAALGRFVLAGKEKLCLIRTKGDALVLETLFVSEDVYAQDEINEAVESTEVKAPELDLARQVIASLAGDFEPAELRSDYRRDLRALLEAKLAGQEIARPEPEPETPVVDLMEALRRSVAEARTRRDAPAKEPKAKPSRPRARASARKTG